MVIEERCVVRQTENEKESDFMDAQRSVWRMTERQANCIKHSTDTVQAW